VAFTDASEGEITEWLWDFGDGTSSSEQSPAHVYSIPGEHTVRLTVMGPGGSTMATLPFPIAIATEPTPTPTRAPTPTAEVTSVPAATSVPTATPTPAPAPSTALSQVFSVDRFTFFDDHWELRVGNVGKWGYQPNEIVSNAGGETIQMRLRVGDSLRVSLWHNAGSRSHGFAIPEFDIERTLTPFSTQGGSTIRFDQPGTYQIVDPLGDEHGSAVIVVEAPPTPTPTPTPQPFATPTPTPAAGAPPPLPAILNGVITYGNRPFSTQTGVIPVINLRPRAPGQSCTDVTGDWAAATATINEETGAYSVSSVAAGDYCLWTLADAAAPFDGRPGLPGDYSAQFPAGGQAITLNSGELLRVDIPMGQHLHMAGSLDNSSSLPTSTPGLSGTFIGSLLDVTWELVSGVTFYTVTISDCADSACTDPFDAGSVLSSGPTVTISIPQVPGGVAYLLEIEGKNPAGLTVASAHFNVGDRWTPGLRFTLAR
jgi:hypothetical protein